MEDVIPGLSPEEATRVDLVCLDDDAQGRPLSVLWELELGARVLAPEAEGLGSDGRIDPPRTFSAYLHALKWSQVTATRADLFQSPFRAGIKLFDHQLAPLKKALELPRANLFIADDVGLGKTIEAGLVISELELRQRVSFVLVVCPASICVFRPSRSPSPPHRDHPVRAMAIGAKRRALGVGFGWWFPGVGEVEA